ncbi:MAG: hypothetical protein QOI71_1779, partial [Gaiellales bacterium]|nr:hypothetical protein [Gaiellales bacterium]
MRVLRGERPARGAPPAASGQNRVVNARRITIAVGLTMLVESTLYQAVVPLLPS